MQAGIPTVEELIQKSLANESATELLIEADMWWWGNSPLSPLTAVDARCIIECLRENPLRFDTLSIIGYRLRDPAVLNVLRDGLPLCTAVTTVNLCTNLENEDLDRLRPAFYNTSITKLHLRHNRIQGRRGDEVIRDLLVGNDTLLELNLSHSGPFGPEVAIGTGIKQGLAVNNRLQILNLDYCQIGNDFLANLLPAEGIINNSLLHLRLFNNNIQGGDGGRQVSLLLQCFPALKVLSLGSNRLLGPLGARALAPDLAAARHLEELCLRHCGLGNDGVANLIPDGPQVVNRSLTNLTLTSNDIEGAEGGRQVSLLLQRIPTLKVLKLNRNDLGPLGARALAPGLAAASQLESLDLAICELGNDGVANLIPSGPRVNSSLTNLDLYGNKIQGAEGGEQVSLLLQRIPTLKVLDLSDNNLGPLGARALAPGLASHLEELDLRGCRLGNDGVAYLVPDGQVNRSLTSLNIGNIQGPEGGEIVVALAARCTNLNRLDVYERRIVLSPDQQRRLDMLLDRNRLYNKACALGGSSFPVLFRFMEEAHRHEQGLSAIFVILQNDGDDYFCTALNRAME